jgi:hypothetical protein
VIQLDRQECEAVVCALRTQYESIQSDLASNRPTDAGRRALEITLGQVTALLSKFERFGVHVVSHAHGRTFN